MKSIASGLRLANLDSSDSYINNKIYKALKTSAVEKECK